MKTWSIPNQIKDPVLFCGSLFWDCSQDDFHWANKHSKHCLDSSGILSLIVVHILGYARTGLANFAWWRKCQINAMAQSRILSNLMVSKACSLKGLTISAIGILGWAILVVLSWVCCYCHSRLLCPRKEVILSPTKGQASPRAAREAHPNQNSSGDSFPYHQAWEAWGQGKINIRMHLSQQLFPTPCRVRQTIPSSNEPSFKEW